jgi:hypothetical protein
MKVLLAFIFVALVSAVQARADKGSEEAAFNINKIVKQLNTLSDVVEKVEKETYPALKTRLGRLNDVEDMLKGAVSHQIAKDADLNMRWQEHDNAVSDHNNSQCTAPANNPHACDAYQAEANRLNAAGVALKQEEAGNNAYKKGLTERYAQLSADTLAYTADAKKANADREDAMKRMQNLLTDITKWANIYGGCMDNIPNATDEEIKHTCGNIQFDGVRKNLGKVRNQGTGGITPNDGPHN